MTAVEKTKALKRESIDVSLIDPTPGNPNEMTDAEFNLLADNIERVGLVDALFVRKLENGRYRLIGGNHRFEVLKVLGFSAAECTVIDDPDFDEDSEKFQVVRMNMIRGKMSPKKFMALYESLSDKYTSEVAAEMFGFTQQEEFNKMVGQMAKSLPADMQAEFKKSAKDIKTVDGLSNLLNTMFTNYGSSLPYGYMVVDYGGQESVWLRMSKKTKAAVLALGDRCRKEGRTVDDLIGGLIRLAGEGKLESTLLQLIAMSKEVSIPEGTGLPTADALGTQGVQ